MKIFLRIILILSFSITFNTSSIAQNSDSINFYLGEIGKEIQTAINSSQIRGATATVFFGDDYHTLTKGIKSTGIPTKADDWYMFRSLTKTMVSTIILQLQEEDKLHIDDPLSAHINPITNVDGSITLRELMAMKSNLCEFTSNALRIIQQNPNAILETKEVLEASIPTGNCNSSKTYDYNDTNFQLLGLVIESVTGNKGEDEFNKRIFSKLTNNTASLAPVGTSSNDFNGLWVSPTGPGGTIIDVNSTSKNSILTGQKFNAGVVGSTKDMMAFMIALLEGDFLDNESLASMKQTGNEGYGLGMMKRDFNDGHILFGHGGGGLNSSRTFYNPELKLGVTVAGNYSDSNTLEALMKKIYTLLTSIVTSSESILETPDQIFLSQNYPNPFNPSTNISFELPQSELVQLKVYNMLGQEVASLVDGRMNSGYHTVNFDASRLSSGVYIYQLMAGNQSITKKMMLIK